MGKRARVSDSTDEPFEAEFSRLGAAGAVHSRSDADRLVCMIQRVRDEMSTSVQRLIDGSGSQPILIAYSSDGMGCRVAVVHNTSTSDGPLVRKGYGLQEFLLQRRFFKTITVR
eukprot:3471252-Amphidinium_carterae.1